MLFSLLLMAIVILAIVLIATVFGWFSDLYVLIFNSAKKTLDRSSDKELEVILTDHEIQLDYVKPDKTDRAWGDSFKNGCIFLKNHANEMVPDNDNNKLFPVQRYRNFMQEELIEKMVDVTTGPDNLLLMILIVLFATLGVGVLNLLVMTGVI